MNRSVIVGWRAAIGAMAPNVVLERSVMLRPLERKPFLAHVTITRQADDVTVRWDFSS